MPMRSLAVLALLLPLAASADDEVPTEAPAEEAPASEAVVDSPGPVTSPSTVTTTTTTPDGTTTTTTTTSAAPGAIAPVSAVSAPAPIVEEDPCSAYKHGQWRSRVHGRLSVGFAKSHLELKDDEGEANQKSFIVRLNGRRGWSIEVELSKLKLGGGDSARTAGASIVKTFGKRRFAPYVLAGGGGGRYESADGTEQKMHFGEIGGGVMFRGKRFSIGIDMRRGVRKLRADDEMTVERGTATPTEADDDRDRYVRGRILALYNF